MSFAKLFSFSTAALLVRSLASAELTPYTGTPPALPENRAPFSYGSLTTGGSAADPSAVFLVDNMPDLRTVLAMDSPRTVYIQGNITGNEITSAKDGGTYADCQWYIDNSPSKQFNFTRYVMSLNESYMDSVKLESEKGGTVEGMDATEYLELLKRMNGWRPRVQNTQKEWVSINVKSDLTLIGMDGDAYLNGVSLIFNLADNVIIRNLKLSPPQDCFPAPEGSTSWNARYDALSLVTSTNFWVDGNTLFDGPNPTGPEPLIWDHKVDRYDGLMDAEDGSDNITFSHNIVGEHHKSLLLGGGLAERARSLGKMRFMFFGNWFSNSASRNPLMRFGTFYVLNNLFTHEGASTAPYRSDFEYNLGVYTESHVVVGGNVFQNAVNGSDTGIFKYSTLLDATTPARLCIPASETDLPEGLQGLGGPSSLNGAEVDLKKDAEATFERALADPTNVVAGGLEISCAGFSPQEVPVTLSTPEEVEAYVKKEAGQMTGGGS
ncbi:uncharacterized protein L3040_006950 [Drepanopeziza brunnea f. sp. 'multigermtubi']|uniref:Polysaccharide lyase family 1 protein n=1 Tax=Marssonina brunnea f. sp. multigermtubi (strain MB_m1) TaxID=1072389 RepID=K1WIX1_MARBU|nr:polysaccharide lyase family 1 protein [Drepanopeziza brunnea f. sp. 'multigermtubi' MB_m1]EKD12796.1 polysaccharide lyase family 1 protein [Drepanopeziza brunnea f. sp. 'multigermtubi' MB_m1]KAJ5038079.1 hypothetical protein L3040_006950 [Drepanopeziza brunnea f. sp. 'multigermtubi']